MAEVISPGAFFQRLCSAHLGEEARCQGLLSAPTSCTSGLRLISKPQVFLETSTLHCPLGLAGCFSGTFLIYDFEAKQGDALT